jgi:cytosine/adenosine deaminase-related metal-dependent hydrolase
MPTVPSAEETVTLVRNARTVVAWDQSRQSHVYRAGLDVAFSRSGIVFVGNDYQGGASRIIDGAGLMVMPGLVDIHSHPSEEPMNKGLWDEVGSPKLYNTSLYEHLVVLDRDGDAIRAAYGVALAELLKSGVTTLCDLSAPSPGWLDILAASGIRAVAAPMFRSGRWFTRNGYRVEYEFNEAAGRAAFERALAEIDSALAHPSGRLGAMLAPSQIDTCSEELLRDAFAEAERRNLPFQTHASQSLSEFHEMTRRHGLTPVEWMERIGILGPRTIVGHGIFLDHHPWTRWQRVDDLARLAEAGATVAHCPTVFARRGITLDHFGRYRQAGVNMGIGTDVYPHNMLDEIRLASYLARTVAGNPRDTTMTDIFDAATIGGAKALLRDDIGRIAVGAKADIVLVDCTHPAMRPCRDPVRSLTYSASDRAVRDVFVDGEQVVRDGEVTTIDYAAAAAALEEAQTRAIESIRRKDWAGRSADELAPLAYPRC